MMRFLGIVLFVMASVVMGLGGICPANASLNQWSKIGPEGGTILSLAVNPANTSQVFAGTGIGGIYRSDDGGVTWAEASNGLNSPYRTSYIASLNFDKTNPSIIYAGTKGGAYLLKSTNGGASWVQIFDVYGGIGSTGGINNIVIDPTNPSVLYAATLSGPYKSTNAGINWTSRINGIEYEMNVEYATSDVAIDPANPATIYAASAGTGIYKSTDGATNWVAKNTGLDELTINRLAIDPATPSTLYAASPQSVYKSTNGGDNWVAINTGLTGIGFMALTIDPGNSQVLYVASDSILFESVDAGMNWAPVQQKPVRAITFAPNSSATVYAGSDAVYKSTDAGQTWVRNSTNMTNTSAGTITTDGSTFPPTLYAGTGNGIIRFDGPGEWTPFNDGLPTAVTTNFITADPSSATLWLGTYDGVFKSVNGGPWVQKNNGISSIFYANFVHGLSSTDQGRTVYRATEAGIYRSTDGGDTWVDDNLGFLPAYHHATAVFVGTTGAVYALGGGGYDAMEGDTEFGLYKRNISTGEWRSLTASLFGPYKDIWAFAADATGQKLYLGTGHRSVDGGASWLPPGTATGAVDNGCGITQAMAIDPTNANKVFNSTSGGVFMTSDGGQSWSAITTGLEGKCVNTLSVDPSGTTLSASTYGKGMYRYTFGTALTAPSARSFGAVATGNSSQQSLTLTNSGANNLAVSSIALSGSGAAAFAITDYSACLPFVAPGNSCAVSITFTPAVAGTADATLSIGYNGNNLNAVAIALNGSGYIPDTTPPATTASPAGGTFFTPATVTLTCSDGTGTGCQKISYSTDGVNWFTYSTPLNITQTTTLSFYATDQAGNNESPANSQTYTIKQPVSQLNAWADLYQGSPNNTSANNLPAGSFAVGSGNNRLLLVAVVMEIGTANTPSITASYGGAALTPAKITANNHKEIVWVGYLKESSIGTGSKPLTITYSGGTGNVSALHVKWAAFSGVNQAAPILSFGGTNTAATSAAFGTVINFVANGMTTAVAGNGGTPATATISASPAFTAGAAKTSSNQSSTAFTTARHTANGSYPATTAVKWSGKAATAWSGVVVVSLQP